jgi:type I restriction enzyme, S subunit
MSAPDLTCPVTTKAVARAPSAWTWSPLPDVARLESGHTPSRRVPAYWEGGDVPWLSLKDIRGLSGKYVTQTVDRPTPLGIENSSARVLPKGTVALCRTASVGNVAILGCDMATSQDFVNWVCGPKLMPEYLYWAFRSSEATFDLEKQGSTHQTIYMPVLEKFRVLLPPLDEQRRIAAVLDEADGIRVKRRAALAQLDALTQASFLDIFGDPVTNPRNWPDPKLGAVLSFQQYGPRFYNESYSHDGVRIVRITDLDEAGNLDFSQMPRLAVSEVDLAKYRLQPGDLIFARTGATVGKVALVRPTDPPCIAGAYFITMRFDKRVTPLYARALLATPSIRAIVTGRSRQAAQQNFSGPGLRELPLPIPPLKLQNEFATRVDSIEKLRSTQRRSLLELDALFASIQHRAFRGQL